MALTISRKRYAEMRAGVERRHQAGKVAEIMREPGATTFQTVDEFLAYLEEPPKDTAPRSRRKRR